MDMTIIIIAVVFLVLVLLGLAIVNFSSEELYAKYTKLSRLPCGTSPFELTQILNNVEFNNRIRIKYNNKLFSDSMSSNFVLTLSEQYAKSYNLAGLIISAHELGHAFQFRDKQKSMVKHSRLIKASKFFCVLFNPLAIIGILLLILDMQLTGFIVLGTSVLSLIIAIISKLSTINIEKEASKNAIDILKLYASFTDEEVKIAKSFLNSAKLTYVADLLRIMLGWTGLVKRR